MVLAKHHGVMIVFDPDYRQIGWKSLEECQLYPVVAIQQADVVEPPRKSLPLRRLVLEQTVWTPPSPYS